MSDKNARIAQIVSALKKKNVMTVRELADILQVSEMTIRRDIAVLEKEHVLSTFYGGVSLNAKAFGSGTLLKTYSAEMTPGNTSKERIARKAASLIESSDVLLFDAGTTVFAMMEYLPADTFNTVYCYSLDILKEVCRRPNYQVICNGGFYHCNTGVFSSEETLELLKRVHVTKAFFGARGITAECGVTTAEPYEVAIKQAAMQVSNTKILLADSSKFGKVWYARFADIREFDIIISDTDLEEVYIQTIEKLGKTLYLV